MKQKKSAKDIAFEKERNAYKKEIKALKEIVDSLEKQIEILTEDNNELINKNKALLDINNLNIKDVNEFRKRNATINSIGSLLEIARKAGMI